MKNKHKITWQCAGCGGQTQTLHEIIAGNGNRQIYIEHNLQVPLCGLCHTVAQGTGIHYTGYSKLGGLNVKACYEYFCRLLQIDYAKTWFDVRNHGDREYIKSISGQCAQKLREWII